MTEASLLGIAYDVVASSGYRGSNIELGPESFRVRTDAVTEVRPGIGDRLWPKGLKLLRTCFQAMLPIRCSSAMMVGREFRRRRPHDDLETPSVEVPR